MKVSINWIRQYRNMYKWSDDPAPDGIDKLVETIGGRLGAVEEVIDLGGRYRGAVIARVVACEKHSNADKLSVCLVDDGRAVKDVKRDKNGLIQVVCGAPNVAAGQLVVWLPPGSTVPESYDDEPFVLEAREIRGVVSNGMIASAKELAIGDDHTGIVVLDGEGRPGQSFAEAYGLDDTIIDIENKMFTHRPDLFGMLGLAREIAGIQHQAFKSPDWYVEAADILSDGRKNVLKLSVKNELPKLVPRFLAVAIKDVKVEPSPVWLRARLSSLGVRPINNIVDLTNYYMLLTAQPLHAYDYDKVKTGVLGVRQSRDGEKVTVIGGKEIKLKKGAIVITDGERPIGLGGVMGGASTEVDENTKNIILEAANFDMNTTRRTAMEYGLFTDAATRFTKNQSSRQQRAVLCKAVEDIRRIVGGRVASPVADDKHLLAKKPPITVSAGFINDRLGLAESAAKIKKLLENVEFKVKLDGETLHVEPPFWRTDVEIAEDIVEEAGRLYGYEHLPLELPKRDIEPAPSDPLLSFKSRIRASLSAAGANEVVTYSFVPGNLLKKAGQNPDDAYHIRNALSPDLQHYRLSLMPSLLDKIHPNVQAGFDEFALFELGKGHLRGLVDEEGLPKEIERIVLVAASKNKKAGAPYYAARAFCDYLLEELGVHKPVYEPISVDKASKTATYYAPGRSAGVFVEDRKIGRVGEFKESVRSAFKLPDYCAGFALDTEELLALSSSKSYSPLNRYPSSSQDICFRSSQDTSFQVLDEFLGKELAEASAEHGYMYSLDPIDIFQKSGDVKHKQTTWHIELWHPGRTLTTQEVNKLFDKIAGQAKTKLKAERV